MGNACRSSQLIKAHFRIKQLSLDKISGPTDLHEKNLDAEKGVKRTQIIRKAGEHAFDFKWLKSNACPPNFQIIRFSLRSFSKIMDYVFYPRILYVFISGSHDHIVSFSSVFNLPTFSPEQIRRIQWMPLGGGEPLTNHRFRRDQLNTLFLTRPPKSLVRGKLGTFIVQP